MALFTGRHRTNLELVGSTNAYLWQQLQHQTLPEGALVTAYHQYAGRGQRIAGEVATEWHSEPGQSITASVVYYPRFLDGQQLFQLNKMASLAVVHTLTSLLPDHTVHIKWPNDILVEGRKIAGLLIDNQLSGTHAAVCVVGIGLNVNQVDWPAAVQQRATSLRLLTGATYLLDDVLAALCDALEARYLQLRSGAYAALDQQYLQCLYRYQEWARYSTPESEMEGMIVGIGGTGQLALQVRGQAQLQYYNFKEIQFVS